MNPGDHVVVMQTFYNGDGVRITYGTRGVIAADRPALANGLKMELTHFGPISCWVHPAPIRPGSPRILLAECSE